MFRSTQRKFSSANDWTDCTVLTLLLMLLTGPGMVATAQTSSRPDRGINPMGSYAVSNIESVNLTNGNMRLAIPLASLPPIAGGKLSWALKAYYNSKLWNTHLREVQDENGNYIETTLQQSNEGGWRIGSPYSIRFVHRNEDYEAILPDPNAPDYYELYNYAYKMVLTTPDGALHELRTVDYPGSNIYDFNRGYYKDSPWVGSVHTSIRYYSFDGSYLWAKIDSFDTYPTSWTVYMPNGTVIEQSNGIQRIKDTNGNKIKMWTESAGLIYTTHYQDELTGREIKYVQDYSGSTPTGQVQYQTVGGTWVSIDITWGTTTVAGKTYEDGSPCNLEQWLSQGVLVVRSIVLPQTEPGQPRQQFSFNYNSDTTDSVNFQWKIQCDPQTYLTNTSSSHGWGSLSQMVTPTGATVNYAHGLDGIHQLGMNPSDAPGEGVRSKSVTHDGTTDTWTYGNSSIVGGVTNPDGSFTTEYFYPHDPALGHIYGGFDGRGGLVYKTNQSNKVLVERHWTRLPFYGSLEFVPGGIAGINPVVDAEYTTLLDDTPSHNPVKMSASTYQYDYNGNLLSGTDYDWFDPALVSRDAQGVPTGVPGSATVLRVVNNTYYNQATGSTSGNVYAKRSLSTGAPLILNAPQQTTIGPSIVQLSYDGQGYGLPPFAGNLTSKSVWDDVGNKWITTSSTYGLYGNLATSTDARGKVTQFFYDDATHALPNRVVVDPQNGTGEQTTTTAYDYYTGLVTSQSDPNNNISNIDYTNQLLGTVDPFGRPGVAIGPVVNVGGVNQRQRMTTTYLDAARQVIVAADLNAENDKLLKTRATSDMLGRVVLSEQSEDGINYSISSRKVYEQMGRITYSSNPARTAPASTDGWTRVTNDLAGRVIEVATFGGAAQPSASPASTIPRWSGSVLTAYSGNKVQATDQDGKSRGSETDALGRLTDVVEFKRTLVDPTVVENPLAADYVTSYKYDVLGNLRKVAQGVQERFFMYDSLSRLIRAKNPEQGNLTPDADFPAQTDSTSGTSNSSWSTAYDYDNNSNLRKRKDARNITAIYSYDDLNRNTFVNYSDTLTDPDITRIYDTAGNGKGRLRESYAGGDEDDGATVEHTKVQSYDALGRPVDQRQRFKTNNVWSAEYQTQRDYNLAGSVTLQTYPSDRTVTYNYDQAGRLGDKDAQNLAFTGYLGGVNRTYATGIVYSPFGGMTQEQFGTDTAIYNKSFYNSRGQLAEIRVATTPNDQWYNRGAIINQYSHQCWGMCSGQSMTDNNGNLKKQEVYIPHNDGITSSTAWVQYYDYDNLNRLQRVHEYTGNPSLDWQQEYVPYDRWGNRRIDPNPAKTYGTGINNLNFEVETATNRMYSPGDLALPDGSRRMRYDNAGNLSKDTYTGAGDRTYDAENRMTQAWANGQWQVYTYNADGQRVRRRVNGIETWQIYGFDGELLAEYQANGATASPQKEYGYRNGQLLVEVTATGGSWGSPPTFTPPNPLVAGVTEVKALHITDLRTAINALRGHLGLSPFSWQQPAGQGDWIKADPILEMRTALDQALGPPSPAYSAGLAQGLLIKKDHIQELRDRVLAAWSSGSSLQINWLVTDQLGTPRIIIDKTGSLANVKRHDYLPFGEEIGANVGLRTPAQGYSQVDTIRQKFTQKERDNETGLDYFLARYYSSTQGRFTSPDEFRGGPDELFILGSGDDQKQALPYADIFQPQSLNKYQYCYNNPLRYVDPDGHDVWEDLKQGFIGGAKVVANIFIEGSPLIAAPNGISKILTGKPLVRPFDASNDAQRAGMTSATVAGVFLPMPGGKTLALERGLTVAEGLAIKSAKNILAKALDTPTLQAAAREAAGEVVAVKSTGVAFDHIAKVKQGLQGLLNADRKFSTSLRDPTLSSSARATLQRTLAKVRTGIQRTRNYMTEHNIQ